jgi:hypothetical protein
VKRDEARLARTADMMAAARRIVRRPATRVAAAAMAATVLFGLVILKAVVHPAWRASARGGVLACLSRGNGGVPDRSADRLHQMQRMGCVVTRLEPIRTDYLELAIALLLIALLAGELRLLARDRDVSRRAATTPRPAPKADRGDTSSHRRLPSPRSELVSPSSPRAGRTRSGRSDAE